MSRVASDVCVIPVSDEKVSPPELLDTADLLVLPGGGHMRVLQDVGEIGFSRIRDFVRKGGVYYGICAAGYFGAQQMEFQKGHPDQVVRPGYLGVFPGVAVGPTHRFCDYVNKEPRCAAANLSEVDRR